MTGPLTCAETRMSLGVLALGAIEPEERPAVEEHLAGCTDCTTALAELAALPGLLRTVRLEDVLAMDPDGHQSSAASAASAAGDAGDDLARRRRLHAAGAMLARRRDRTRRLRRAVAATAAAGLALAAVALGIVLLPRAEQGPAAPVTASASNPATAARARFTLQPLPNGTRVSVAMSGVRPGERCRLLAVDTSGRREVAASWVASYQGRVAVTGSTAVPLADIARLTVVGHDGTVLVSTRVG